MELTIEDTFAVIEGDSRHRYIPAGGLAWATGSKEQVIAECLGHDSQEHHNN